MKYIASIPELDKNKLMVLPISMNQPLERGQRLDAILRLFRSSEYQENITIILCDYLNRHNCSHDSVALEQGDSFLADHKEILDGFKVIRWQDFLVENQASFSQYLEMIEVASASPQSMFYLKMEKTWKKCLSSQAFEASLKYQKEEYAAVLCMSKFGYLFYPKKITDGLSFLYQYSRELKISIPSYIPIKVSEFKQSQDNSVSFFSPSVSQNSSKKGNHVHIAFRGLIEHAHLLLNTKELSTNSKKIFVEEMENIFRQYDFSPDNQSSFVANSEKELLTTDLESKSIH